MLSRLKFEIDPLVTEMLDQIPEDQWTSKTSTFFDPAMAGGQFVAAIEDKLRKYGHSDKNIAKRVYGCESNVLRVQYAINKHNLVGEYWVDDFLESEYDMKFDNIVGNPPFSSGLWKKFIKKSIKLTNKNILMISPNGVTQYSTTAKSKSIKKILLDAGVQKIYNVTNYFPDVSSGEISAYICDVSIPANESAFIKEGIEHTITDKVINKSGDKLEALLANQLPDYGKYLKSIKPKKGYTKALSSVTSSGHHEYIWIKDYNNKLIDGSDYWFSNRFFGSSKSMALVDINESIIVGQNILSIKKIKGYSIEQFKEIYTSKLIRFVLNTIKNGKFDTPLTAIKMLPIIPLDIDVYKHFKLTKEEIAYIEANVK